MTEDVKTMKDADIKKAMKGAEKKGWITAIGKGRYMLTQRGKEFVESLPR